MRAGGRLWPVPLGLAGVCVGAGTVVGAGVGIAPGRALPAGLQVVADNRGAKQRLLDLVAENVTAGQ